jgi:hypothetical protein
MLSVPSRAVACTYVDSMTVAYDMNTYARRDLALYALGLGCGVDDLK